MRRINNLLGDSIWDTYELDNKYCSTKVDPLKIEFSRHIHS